MRIKYNILWVDDRKEIFLRAEYDKQLIDYVNSLFFEPHLTMCESVDEAKKALDEQPYDVIFSDYNISDSEFEEQGNDFINYVRNKNVNTEILFYSAMENLPLIGVNRISFYSFFGQQSAYKKLLEQMKVLINLTVEKLNDITALRGLVMAEVSELDVLMEQIILRYFDTRDKINIFHEHITANREQTWHKMLNTKGKCDKQCFHIWREKDLSEFVGKLDSSQKAHAINIVLQQIDSQHAICTDAKFFKVYNEMIIMNRNNLAHCRSMIGENGAEVLQTWCGDKIYTDEAIKDMRANILKYYHIFITLLDALK